MSGIAILLQERRLPLPNPAGILLSMPDTKIPTQASHRSSTLWLAVAWLLLVPAIVYCYRHIDRPLALWFHAQQSRQWPILSWPHQISEIFVYLLPLIFIACGVWWWRQQYLRVLPVVFDAAMSLAVVLAVKS